MSIHTHCITSASTSASAVTHIIIIIIDSPAISDADMRGKVAVVREMPPAEPRFAMRRHDVAQDPFAGAHGARAKRRHAQRVRCRHYSWHSWHSWHRSKCRPKETRDNSVRDRRNPEVRDEPRQLRAGVAAAVAVDDRLAPRAGLPAWSLAAHVSWRIEVYNLYTASRKKKARTQIQSSTNQMKTIRTLCTQLLGRHVDPAH
jgi:hypothetical protein